MIPGLSFLWWLALHACVFGYSVARVANVRVPVPVPVPGGFAAVMSDERAGFTGPRYGATR